MRPAAEQAQDEKTSEASAVYLRLKALWGGGPARGAASSRRRRAAAEDESASKPFGLGRDPKGLGDVMQSLTAELGWDSSLEQSVLVAQWAELVGADTAAKTSPIGVADGVLTVHCESTAWATQLRLMRNELLAHIAHRYPNAGIEQIRFQGPDVPSWKKGPRSIPGRGPRDTYG